MFVARRSRAERDRGEIRLRDVDRLFGRSRPENRKLGHICCANKVHYLKQFFFLTNIILNSEFLVGRQFCFVKLSGLDCKKVNFHQVSFG